MPGTTSTKKEPLNVAENPYESFNNKQLLAIAKRSNHPEIDRYLWEKRHHSLLKLMLWPHDSDIWDSLARYHKNKTDVTTTTIFDTLLQEVKPKTKLSLNIFSIAEQLREISKGENRLARLSKLKLLIRDMKKNKLDYLARLILYSDAVFSLVFNTLIPDNAETMLSPLDKQREKNVIDYLFSQPLLTKRIKRYIETEEKGLPKRAIILKVIEKNSNFVNTMLSQPEKFFIYQNEKGEIEYHSTPLDKLAQTNRKAANDFYKKAKTPWWEFKAAPIIKWIVRIFSFFITPAPERKFTSTLNNSINKPNSVRRRRRRFGMKTKKRKKIKKIKKTKRKKTSSKPSTLATRTTPEQPSPKPSTPESSTSTTAIAENDKKGRHDVGDNKKEEEVDEQKQKAVSSTEQSTEHHHHNDEQHSSSLPAASATAITSTTAIAPDPQASPEPSMQSIEENNKTVTEINIADQQSQQQLDQVILPSSSGPSITNPLSSDSEQQEESQQGKSILDSISRKESSKIVDSRSQQPTSLTITTSHNDERQKDKSIAIGPIEAKDWFTKYMEQDDKKEEEKQQLAQRQQQEREHVAEEVAASKEGWIEGNKAFGDGEQQHSGPEVKSIFDSLSLPSDEKTINQSFSKLGDSSVQQQSLSHSLTHSSPPSSPVTASVGASREKSIDQQHSGSIGNSITQSISHSRIHLSSATSQENTGGNKSIDQQSSDLTNGSINQSLTTSQPGIDDSYSDGNKSIAQQSQEQNSTLQHSISQSFYQSKSLSNSHLNVDLSYSHIAGTLFIKEQKRTRRKILSSETWLKQGTAKDLNLSNSATISSEEEIQVFGDEEAPDGYVSDTEISYSRRDPKGKNKVNKNEEKEEQQPSHTTSPASLNITF